MKDKALQPLDHDTVDVGLSNELDKALHHWVQAKPVDAERHAQLAAGVITPQEMEIHQAMVNKYAHSPVEVISRLTTFSQLAATLGIALSREEIVEYFVVADPVAAIPEPDHYDTDIGLAEGFYVEVDD